MIAVAVPRPAPSLRPVRPAPIDEVIPADDASDADLLAGLRRRDEGALAALHDRYARYAFGLAYRIVDDPGAAEEIVQESFLQLWRRAADYDPDRGAVRTWLRAIVHHRAVDYRRRPEARRGALPLASAEHRLVAPDVVPALIAAEDRARVRRALAALPPAQRRTVELAYGGGLAQREIAAAMGVPLSTVKGRIRLAFLRLRALLAESG
jgi:RNA polymerase sigma-70 factor (ECF subfamily)